MNTIYLLDALFILVLGMTALFGFGMVASRHSKSFKIIFFVSFALFLLTLWMGHWPMAGGVPMPPASGVKE